MRVDLQARGRLAGRNGSLTYAKPEGGYGRLPTGILAEERSRQIVIAHNLGSLTLLSTERRALPEVQPPDLEREKSTRVGSSWIPFRDRGCCRIAGRSARPP